MKRVFARIVAARGMWAAGLSAGSILLFPLRRRFGKTMRVRLRKGPWFTAARNEPLVRLVKDVWVQRRYGNPDLGAGDTIVDIGANVGVFALLAGWHRPRTRVIAVEPSASAFAHLNFNIQGNDCGNVIPVKAACSGATGVATLYRRGGDTLNSIYSDGDLYGSTFRAEEQVEAVTLDQLFARFAICKCRLLKLDCEGAEYEILYAASPDTLASIERIAMEYHVGLNAHTPAELVAYLEARGVRGGLQAIRRPRRRISVRGAKRPENRPRIVSPSAGFRGSTISL